MSKSNEAFWWSLFSAGGVMSALFIPVIILVTGFLLPTTDSARAVEHYEHVSSIVGWWPVSIVLLGVISLSMFHCVHRIRHVLMDFGLRRFDLMLMIICYGGAFSGTLATAYLLWKI